MSTAKLEARAVALIRQAAALPNGPIRLMGLDEIARMTDRAKSTISSWYYRDKILPPPVARLRCGPVWEAATVEAWWQERNIGASFAADLSGQ